MKKTISLFRTGGMASTLCAQERGDMLVSGSLSWSRPVRRPPLSNKTATTKYQLTSFGLNVDAMIAFTYYFLIRTTTAGCLAPSPCAPGSGKGIIPVESPETITIYRKPKSQRLKHLRNHKQTEPMKLINIARSILVIGYVMLVSCSSDEGWRKRQWAAGNRPGTRTATPGHTLETGQRNQSRRQH